MSKTDDHLHFQNEESLKEELGRESQLYEQKFKEFSNKLKCEISFDIFASCNLLQAIQVAFIAFGEKKSRELILISIKELKRINTEREEE